MGEKQKKTPFESVVARAFVVALLAVFAMTGCTPSDAPDMQSEQAKAEQKKQLEDMAKSGKGPVDEGMAPGDKL
jgi:hypothetical protein